MSYPTLSNTEPERSLSFFVFTQDMVLPTQLLLFCLWQQNVFFVHKGVEVPLIFSLLFLYVQEQKS